MTANEKKELSCIVQLRRTANFQADVIRRYARFMADLEKIEAEKDVPVDAVHKMAWAVRLDITKMIEKQ